MNSRKAITDTILMIRPVNFRYNEETAVNNYYQKVRDDISPADVQEQARKEFEMFVEKLRTKGIRVIVIEDSVRPETPDSIFPNNWVSFHQDGKVGLYPMFAQNRRLERRNEIFDVLDSEYGLHVRNMVDFTGFEKEHKFLEGTGSMVLDRVNKIAYAAISERTDIDILREFCSRFSYEAVTFTAYQTVGEERLPIYHTNVMMCVGDTFAVICTDCIDDSREREKVMDSLEKSGKEIVTITESQVQRFAGNMLEVCARKMPQNKYLVMSASAYQSLTREQRKTLSRHCELVYSSLDTIEALGGGSARCMMAEVFLPEAPKNS
ncbi:MAG: arginine deiminase-related protein [Cyclobacteriaceae bacterium]